MLLAISRDMPERCSFSPNFGGRKLSPNLFSQTFRAPPGYPGKSQDIPPKKFGFLGFEGHTELFGPHPFTWKSPTPPEEIRTKKFWFGFLFSSLKLLRRTYQTSSSRPHLRVEDPHPSGSRPDPKSLTSCSCFLPGSSVAKTWLRHSISPSAVGHRFI